MHLNTDQIQLVQQDVQREGISYSHLEYDLLDHVCCDIEDRMRMGISFKAAYEEVKKDIGLQGLRRVQQETLLLINKNYRIMKKSMKALGTIALAATSFAVLAKINHWPGASVFIILSTLIVSVIFFPAALYVWYKEVFQKKHGFIVLLTFLGGFTFMNGTLFKILHWPYANLLLGVGEILIIFTIVIGGISYLLSKQSKSDSLGLLITGIISIIIFSTGTLFKLMHWPFASELLIIGSILLFSIFLPVYAYHKYKNEKTVKNSFIFSVYALTFIITFTFLLAINFSKGILDNYIYRINELHYSIATIENQINDISELPENANEINLTANKLFNSITDLKKGLVVAAGGIDINVNHLKRGDLGYLKGPGANKINNKLLKGNAQNGKAYKLNKDIQEYKSILIKSLENSPFAVDFINEILSMQQDNALDWIKHNFNNAPLITSINSLSQLQFNIRLAQQEALTATKTQVTENQHVSIQE